MFTKLIINIKLFIIFILYLIDIITFQIQSFFINIKFIYNRDLLYCNVTFYLLITTKFEFKFTYFHRIDFDI